MAWLSPSRCRSEQNRRTSSRARSKSRVARQHSRSSSKPSRGTPYCSSSPIASHHDGRTAGLTDTVSSRPRDGGGDKADGDESGRETHVDDVVLFVGRVLLTSKCLNGLWVALNQVGGISLGDEASGDKKVGWGRGARLQVGLSHI